MIIRIKGEIQKGLDQASTNTLVKQKPFLKKYIPNIDLYYTGTINLMLERPLIIFNPDIKTDPIEWANGFVESFGFLKIKFETIPPTEDMPIDAWIYIPYRSPHYPNPFYKEILAPTVSLDNVQYCNIIIEKKFKEISGIVI